VGRRNSLAEIAEAAKKSQRFNVQSFSGVLERISSLRELGDLCESHSGVGLKPDLQRATYVGSCTVGRALARLKPDYSVL
jgi:hypothetical protein